MSEPLSVPRAARHVRGQWESLANVHGTGQRFHAALAEDLPLVARRWIVRAVAENTPLARAVQLEMHGQIRLGDWRPFAATQLIAPGEGFIWAATAKVRGLPILGYDRFTDGSGEMRWRVGGLIPVMSARGRDVTDSAAGRLAGESIFVPTAFPLARWTGDGNDVSATWTVAGREETVHLNIAEDGALRGVWMQRWGNPEGQGFGRYRFTVAVESERTFAGITIPARLRAGWDTGGASAGEFFRAEITDAHFR
ncbi:DUF6544 family protein [Rhodococcus sp. NPDC019627]|uniref:DUF6544 family protein n=1 Tax=unclassified Rhodococcus (in: high G+C Gram-positive bacteria) TaxID=192944 RepID=UPI003411EA0E